MSIEDDKKYCYESSQGMHLCCRCIHANEVECGNFMWTTIDENSCKLIRSRYTDEGDDPIET